MNGMRISVTHSTDTATIAPSVLEPHIFRLRPRTNVAQRLLAYRHSDLAGARGHHGVSGSGWQPGLKAWFGSPTAELSVVSRFTVETYRENPFDYVLTGESLNLPLFVSRTVARRP